MELNIAICDDDPVALDTLRSYVSAWASTKGHRAGVMTFPSAEAFLFEYSENKAFDLLLLDVEMKKMSGVELAKRMRRENCRAEILFITSHFEFYGEGYEVDALHYLIKPVSEAKLAATLDRAAEKMATEPPSLLIRQSGETVKVWESEILYVESMLHYLSVVTRTGEYCIKENLSAMEEKLSDGFYRIHRSYLVSLHHITRISRTAVTVTGGKELPLARGKYDDVNRAFIAHN